MEDRAELIGSAPSALEAYESAVLSVLGVRRQEAPVAEWGRAYSRLSQALTSDRASCLERGTSGDFADPASEAVAALVHGARTFRIARSLVEAYAPPPGPIVELGAGWGPFALAAAAAGAERIELVDSAETRLNRAVALLSAFDLTAARTRGDALRWRGAALAAIAVPFVLNELVEGAPNPVDAGVQLVRRWMGMLAADGLLFVLDPGTRTSGRLLQSIRDVVCAEFQVEFPCTHRAPCPYGPRPKDWCHFTWRSCLGPLARQISDHARRTHGVIHFSGLVLRRAKPDVRQPAARVLDTRSSDRKKARLVTCGPDGLVQLTALRRAPSYTRMLDLGPGDLLEWPVEPAHRKGDGWRVDDAAELRVRLTLDHYI